MNTRIVFFGTPDFVVPVLEHLSKNFDVVGVVTAPDSIEGRKKILTPSPVKKFAVQNLPHAAVFTPQQFNNTTIQQLHDLNPDIFVVAAYGKILPQELLDLPKFGAINIHPSLLPKYRGPSPIQTAILNGESKTGVTIIKMDEKMDHGPILSQWSYEIQITDTFESMHYALFKQAAEKLSEIISNLIKGDVKPVPQNDHEATYCQKITKADGFVDDVSTIDPAKLDRMVRAFYPWPTVWTKLKEDFGGQAKKGALLKLLPGKRIQLEGKSVMSYKDAVNGYPGLKMLLEPLLA